MLIQQTLGFNEIHCIKVIDFILFYSILQDLDIRIVIGSFSDEILPKIFCEVRR
jgi:hypothetical protein